MPAQRIAKRNVLVVQNIIPGGFYQGVHAGGFTDGSTGIHIPGPTVIVDEKNNRQIIAIATIPSPVQIPHFKIGVDNPESTVRDLVELPFDRQDSTPLHDGLFLAASTGIIRHIPDEDVEENYPEAWANRKDKFVFTRELAITPMIDMILEAEIKANKARKKIEALEAKGNPLEKK